VAEIYHEVWLDPPQEIDGVPGHPKFDRILVGAPLWIRTSSIRAVRMSDEYSETEVDQDFDRRARIKERIKRWRREFGFSAQAPLELPAQRPRPDRPS